MRSAISFAALVASLPVPAEHHIRTINAADICYTSTAKYRHVTEATKRAVYRRDGVPFGNHTGICSGVEGCEIDHRVSLELGGSNDISNLMVQPYAGPCNAHQKDRLENKLHVLICTKQMGVTEAQRIIYDDWQSAYKTHIDPMGCQ